MTPTYVDKATGEVYDTHSQAMEAYRSGHEIELYTYDSDAGALLRTTWEI